MTDPHREHLEAALEPWSVRTRILSYPLGYVPIWNRIPQQGVTVTAWFAANPVISRESGTHRQEAEGG